MVHTIPTSGKPLSPGVLPPSTCFSYAWSRRECQSSSCGKMSPQACHAVPLVLWPPRKFPGQKGCLRPVQGLSLGRECGSQATHPLFSVWVLVLKVRCDLQGGAEFWEGCELWDSLQIWLPGKTLICCPVYLWSSEYLGSQTKQREFLRIQIMLPAAYWGCLG